jgi:hypothetical protein
MSALASLSDAQLVSQVSTILDSKASTSLLRTVGEEYQKPSVAAEYYLALILYRDELASRVRNVDTLLSASSMLQLYYAVCGALRSMPVHQESVESNEEFMSQSLELSISRGNTSAENVRLSNNVDSGPVEL